MERQPLIVVVSAPPRAGQTTLCQGAGGRGPRPRHPASFTVAPPTFALLETRLRQRRSDSQQEIRQRLARAREELQHYREYRYIVVNDVFDDAVKQLCSIITAERSRSDRVDLSFLDEVVG